MHPHKFVCGAIPAELQGRLMAASADLQYSYSQNTSYSDKGQEITGEVYDVGQFVSKLNKDWEPLVYELLEHLKPHIPESYKIHRAKMNVMWRCVEAGTRWNSPHIDNPNDGVLAIVYYVNGGDGDTCIFYDEGLVRIKPMKGAALILPANQPHASSYPIEAFDRMVLNIVVSVKDPL